eukprot:gnl/TRDRNA2_/TRDRNA2_149001_c0_seq2.p1 gnl/TRDRNA2_/TRDRNA2_149001_c0~~gnl/TRDRNA2_/TRDRNA2_149001_c0_seq2.p1  ORF type:complete len:175 (+),score=16.75 gnl/TRDRNA2_/TRDRNA2_149001_c0_seq2:145-669(+)
MFVRGTFLANLLYGVSNSADVETSRIVKICQRLGMTKQTMKYVVNPKEILNWMEVLSQSQRQLAMIARSLIACPHVLCMHKPTQFFDDLTGDHIMHLLKEFVESKGLEEDSSTIAIRRPRTCICTSATKRGLQLADTIYLMDGGGLSQVGIDDITPDVFHNSISATFSSGSLRT